MNMKIRRSWFNIYFLALATLFVVGCETTEQKQKGKEAATMRLHMESRNEPMGKLGNISINRENPIPLSVKQEPFLDSGDIDSASVVDYMGGFVIQLQMNEHGTFVLDMTTTSNKGRRMAIFANWGPARWLAAPMIDQRIANGIVTFTPDCTREEAERIATGLNNVSKKLKKSSFF